MKNQYIVHYTKSTRPLQHNWWHDYTTAWQMLSSYLSLGYNSWLEWRNK